MRKLSFTGRFGLKLDGLNTPEIKFYGPSTTMNLLDKLFMRRCIICTKELKKSKGVTELSFDVDDIFDELEVLRFSEEFECRFRISPEDGETPQVEFIGRRETMNCLDDVFLNRGVISYKEWDFRSESILSLRFNIDDVVSKSDLL